MNRRQFITVAGLACGAGCSGISTSSTPSTPSDSRARTEAKSQTESTESERTPTLREGDVPMLKLGESYAWSESVELWIDEVEFTRTFRMENGETLSPSTEMAVLEAPVYTVSTTGERVPIEGEIPSPAWVLYTDHGRFDPLAPTDARPVGNVDTDFVYDADTVAYPIESTGGSLLFEVPRRTTEFGLVLTDDETGDPIAAWTGAVNAEDFPELITTEINADAQAQDTRVRVAVRFENGESSTAVFYPTVSIRSADGTVLATEEPSFKLHPYAKKTVEYTVATTSEEITELRVEISPGEEVTIPIVSIRKPWRGHYTMENGVQVSLSAPSVGEAVTVVNGEAEEMSEVVEPQRYLQVAVQVRNPTTMDREPPALDWFEVDTPTTSRAHRPLDRSAYEEPRSEILYPNDAIHGTLYFSVPEGTYARDTNCRGVFPTEVDGPEICEWGPVW